MQTQKGSGQITASDGAAKKSTQEETGRKKEKGCQTKKTTKHGQEKIGSR